MHVKRRRPRQTAPPPPARRLVTGAHQAIAPAAVMEAQAGAAQRVRAARCAHARSECALVQVMENRYGNRVPPASFARRRVRPIRPAGSQEICYHPLKCSQVARRYPAGSCFRRQEKMMPRARRERALRVVIRAHTAER